MHVLPGASEPDYTSDPPTSGPHQPSPAISGVADEPIARPVQVGLLEAGRVLVQHRDDADAVALADLAGGDVVVAPNPELDSRVVATAWTWKLTCDDVDLADLRSFADARAGQGPADH
jgi:hypothetical protein